MEKAIVYPMLLQIT